MPRITYRLEMRVNGTFEIFKKGIVNLKDAIYWAGQVADRHDTVVDIYRECDIGAFHIASIKNGKLNRV
jgi:hypothetical protein